MKRTLALVVAVSTLVGCGARPEPKVAASHAHPHSHDPSDHNHDRGSMMIASDGWVDALLTAHLSSKDGNELDVFVERSGKPLALGTTELRAKAEVGGVERALVFACAPAEERPTGEADGTCSHFVARAGWMNADDALRVEAALPLRRGDVGYVWRAFSPRKYAHHVD